MDKAQLRQLLEVMNGTSVPEGWADGVKVELETQVSSFKDAVARYRKDVAITQSVTDFHLEQMVAHGRNSSPLFTGLDMCDDELAYVNFEQAEASARAYIVTTPTGRYVMATGAKDCIKPEYADRRFMVDWFALNNLTPEERKELTDAHGAAMRGIHWRRLKKRLLHDALVNDSRVLFDEGHESPYAGKTFVEMATDFHRMVELLKDDVEGRFRITPDEPINKPKTYGPPRIGKGGKVRRW